MLDKLKKVGKDTVIYGLGSAISKLLGFILIPIYISHIPISAFGNLTIFEITIQFLSVLFTFGIYNAHQRFFYSEKNAGTYGVFLFNNYFGNLFLILLCIAPLLLFPGLFSGFLFGDASQSRNIQIALLIIPADVLFNLILQIYQFERKPYLFLLSSVLKLLISLLLTIYMVVYLSMGIEGILWARLIGSIIIVTVLTIIIVIPRAKLKMDFSVLINSIRFGLPMIISSIGSMIFLLSDRYMLNILSTEAEVGKYSFGLKIANFINLIFIQTIGLSYLPSAIDIEDFTKNIRYYRKMLTYYCFVIGFIILGFLFFYQEALSFIGTENEYWEGMKVVPFICLSFMIMGMNYFVGIGLFLTKKTNFYLIPAFVAAAINIALNIKLIPAYGMFGACFSLVFAQIIYMGILSYLSGKQIKISYEWGKILTIFFISISLFVISTFINFKPLILSLLVKAILLCFLPLFLYFLNFFEQVEIERLRQSGHKLFSFFVKKTK